MNDMIITRIEIDNLQERYSPGSTIRGKVICTPAMLLHGDRLTVELKGEECRNWEGRNQRNTFLLLEQTYSITGQLDINRGEFLFEFTLPNDVPTTYKYLNNWVKFCLKVKIDEVYEASHAVTVFAPVDLNDSKYERMLHAIETKQKKLINLLCFPIGSIAINVYLPTAAFTEGEEVPISVNVRNYSAEHIHWMELALISIVEVVSDPKVMKKRRSLEKKTLVKCRQNGVLPKSARDYIFILPIPKYPVRNFTLCKLFKAYFIIEVRGFLAFLSDVVVETPIVIGVGNTPLRGRRALQGLPPANSPASRPIGITPPSPYYSPAADPSAPRKVSVPPPYDALYDSDYLHPEVSLSPRVHPQFSSTRSKFHYPDMISSLPTATDQPVAGIVADVTAHSAVGTASNLVVTDDKAQEGTPLLSSQGVQVQVISTDAYTQADAVPRIDSATKTDTGTSVDYSCDTGDTGGNSN